MKEMNKGHLPTKDDENNVNMINVIKGMTDGRTMICFSTRKMNYELSRIIRHESSKNYILNCGVTKIPSLITLI